MEYLPHQVYKLAVMAHEANRRWCELSGDHSQTDWGHAPGWQQDSAMQGVRFVLENPELGDSAQHDSWMAQKISEGWVYGDVKDAGKKTHPCLVPFDRLPPHQQAKDRLFRAVVLALVAAV